MREALWVLKTSQHAVRTSRPDPARTCLGVSFCGLQLFERGAGTSLTGIRTIDQPMPVGPTAAKVSPQPSETNKPTLSRETGKRCSYSVRVEGSGRCGSRSNRKTGSSLFTPYWPSHSRARESW
ncbi:hypothetical protein FA13DRAFT_1738037 [Coprinellus micaceus]|uniref:Uncharacterized protein n=1 Tax=Coprinellus micaceus TaxID=71717 RepID=A0A4Y7SV17_COPMI|nr:hypothetical protein FA13DRAFT_1738037 [Coprinellus micaceus]